MFRSPARSPAPTALYAELDGSSVEDGSRLPKSWLNGAAKLVYTGMFQSDLTGGTQPAQLSASIRFVGSCIMLMRAMSACGALDVAEIP